MLTPEQIINLIERRRQLLHERAQDDIAHGNSKTRGYTATVAEYNSLEVLLHSIRTGRMDTWDVAPETEGR